MPLDRSRRESHVFRALAAGSVPRGIERVMTKSRPFKMTPPEHVSDTSDYQLSSRTPTRVAGNLQAPKSHDPYYETFNDVVRHPSTTTISQARSMHDLGSLRLAASYRRPPLAWPADFLKPSRRTTTLNFLGALCSYRAMTNNQAATFADAPELADPRCMLVSGLFAAGVLALASPYVGHSLGVAGGGTAAYEIANVKRLEELRAHLTWAEWLAITGNRPLPTEPVHLRHDILGAELGLRASEYLHVGAVLGPHFSRMTDLTALSLRPETTTGSADLTIVRDDGLRIAIELTSSLGQRFRGKVRRWVRILREQPLRASGLVVVFLVAPSPAMLDRAGDRVRLAVYREVAAATLEDYETVQVASRIGVATWREWFPSSLVASEAFVGLRVDRPTGRSDALWERCDLWNPEAFPFEAREPEEVRAIASNASFLSQTAPWLRWRHAPAEKAAMLLRDTAGEPDDVAPQRQRSRVRHIGSAQGVANGSTIPAPLLGPTDVPERTTSHPVRRPSPERDPWTQRQPTYGHRLTRRIDGGAA